MKKKWWKSEANFKILPVTYNFFFFLDNPTIFIVDRYIRAVLLGKPSLYNSFFQADSLKWLVICFSHVTQHNWSLKFKLFKSLTAVKHMPCLFFPPAVVSISLLTHIGIKRAWYEIPASWDTSDRWQNKRQCPAYYLHSFKQLKTGIKESFSLEKTSKIIRSNH